MFDYIDNAKLNKDYLYKVLDWKQENLSIYESQDLIRESWERLLVDFSYTGQECAKTLWSIFQKNSDNLHNILNLDEFHNYEKFLKDMGQDIDDEFIDKIIKQYIDKLIEQERSINIHEHFKQDFIKKYYPYLLDYCDLTRKEKLIHQIDRSAIEEILNKVINGWGEKDQYILNNISVETYKAHIISSVSFVESIIDFLSAEINHTSHFANATKNIKLALKDLREVNNDYKYKVDKIIERTNIKLDD
jgi:hypothetical protein